MEIRARRPDLQTKRTAPAPHKVPTDFAIARSGKVFDAIQSRCLLSYLIKHRLITENRFGFITHQLLGIVYDWLQAHR